MTEREIFLAVIDLPNPSARAAYLDMACGADSALRGRVEALLQSHEGAGSFLGTPAAVIPDPERAATRAFSHNPDTANTRTYGHECGSLDDEIPLGFLTPSSRADSLGRIGHYEVLQVLGQGGFGIVFRAFDDVLQRVVAVKVLAPQLAATSPARKRFLREARTSAAIRHENVVQVYEVGEAPLPYIAMEFIPGETLQQQLDRIGPVEAVEVVRIGRQIAEGLAAAHANDLIHRDIKPGNILLESGHQKVKITDFGLARAADDASISQSGIIAGTPMYMAPEQAKGDKLDQRADLFSLGSVLYQMAAGRPPFRANSTVAVLKRVAEDAPRDIREIIPETPQWLCDIIAKLHAKNPDDRFQSAREVADVLADCEAQLKENAKLKDFSKIPVSKRPDSRGSVGRWVAISGLVVFAVCGLVAVVAGLFFRSPQEKPKDDTNVVVQPSQPTAVTKQEPLPPTFTNTIGMEFVKVQKGKSWLGGSKDKLGDKEVEIPADFYLGKYEVTQEEWTQVMGENSSHFSRTGDGKDAVKDISDADLKRFPVESVSWDQCQAFVAKLNQREMGTGWVYRLPKPTEWEYACRGGPMTDRADSAFDYYLMKPMERLLPEDANFGKRMHRTCKTGLHQPNRLGLFDMHGNVQEWCDDSEQPANDDGKLLRGGSYRIGQSEAKGLAAGPPAFRGDDLGLRLARVPAGAPSPVAKTPFTDDDVKRIAALPAAEQIEEVRKELMRRNPGFDGKMETKIDGDVVTEFRILADQVTDISPIRVWSALRVLQCKGRYANGQLADLTSLKGMNVAGLTILDLTDTKVSDAGMVNFMECKNLTELYVVGTQVSDAGLVHFQDCQGLTHLYLAGTMVSDVGLAHFKDRKNLACLSLAHTRVGDAGLVHFKDCKGLVRLYLSGTKVSDAGLAQFKDCKNLTHLILDNTQGVGDAGLAHFKGMPLRDLAINHTGITDLTPLQSMPLEEIRLTPKNITKGLDILRAMKSVKTIGIGYGSNQSWPAAEFWERFDKGEFKE